jgi:hypothetical protein
MSPVCVPCIVQRVAEQLAGTYMMDASDAEHARLISGQDIKMLLANSQAAGARATKREVWVWEWLGSVNQVTSRTRFIAIAISTCWSWIFGKPR